MITVNKKIGSGRVSFTPSFYKRAYLNYKNGAHRELIAMMKESQTDSQVIGCLQGRKAGFMKDIQFSPFDQENSKDVERAEFYQSIFKRIKVRSLFKAIMEARYFKYKVIDFEWEVIDGLQVPVSFKAFDQKYFRYDTEGDGKLKIDQGKKLEEFPPETLVLETDEMPVMLPVLRDYILKEFGLEAWASFLETFGEGIIIGYYPPGSDPTIKQQLDDAVNSIASSSRGTAPKGTDISIVESNRTTGDHEKFKDSADAGIAISILGHANAVKQSAGMNVGENMAPFKPQEQISVDDLYFIDEAIDQLIQIIHDRNFGDQRYPSAVTAKPDPMSKKERRENLKTAFEFGFPIHAEDVRKLGVRVDAEEEPRTKQDPFTYNV